MKIITDNAVYVQKDDLLYMNPDAIDMPRSLSYRIYQDYHDYRRKREFVQFNRPEEILYIRGLDWLLDYSSVKDMSCEELKALIDSVSNEEKRMQENVYSSESKGKELWNGIVLGLKKNNLNDILLFKEGKLDLVLPEGIEYPERVTKKDKGIKRLVKTLFGGRN